MPAREHVPDDALALVATLCDEADELAEAWFDEHGYWGNGLPPLDCAIHAVRERFGL